MSRDACPGHFHSLAPSHKTGKLPSANVMLDEDTNIGTSFDTFGCLNLSLTHNDFVRGRGHARLDVLAAGRRKE